MASPREWVTETRACEISGERGIRETSSKTSSNGAQRTLVDAWGCSMTNANSLIPKRPLTPLTRAPSCQGGRRGFDPRFPLQRLQLLADAGALSGPQSRAAGPMPLSQGVRFAPYKIVAWGLGL